MKKIKMMDEKGRKVVVGPGQVERYKKAKFEVVESFDKKQEEQAE